MSNNVLLICKFCDNTAELLRDKKRVTVIDIYNKLKKEGWIINLKNRKKSICPQHNLFAND